MSLMQSQLAFPIYRTLGTMRTQMLAIGAIVGRSGRKVILRLSLQGPFRERFEGYLRILFPSQKINCAAVGTG